MYKNYIRYKFSEYKHGLVKTRKAVITLVSNKNHYRESCINSINRVGDFLEKVGKLTLGPTTTSRQSITMTRFTATVFLT